MLSSERYSKLDPDLRGRFTAIWQTGRSHENEWIEEILGYYIGRHILDGEHKAVADYSMLIDRSINKVPREYYELFRGGQSFLVHFLDETYEGGYERYLPFRGVLREFWASQFDGRRIHRFPLGYGNGLRAPATLRTASERTYIWSIAGELNKSSRPDAVRAFRRLEPSVVQATDGFAPRDLQIAHGRLPATALAAILQDSVFSPSPMGNINLECFRMYEALEAGSIPILERRFNFDYYRRLLGNHPLPTFATWPQAARFVRHIIGRPSELDELQTTCIAWWTEAKQKLIEDIGLFLTERLDSVDGLTPSDFGSLNRRAEQYIELLKHQTAATIGRRIQRHAARFVKTGRFRHAESGRQEVAAVPPTDL
jgi:hypothetical protein